MLVMSRDDVKSNLKFSGGVKIPNGVDGHEMFKNCWRKYRK